MDDIKIIELYFERNERAIKETDLKYGRLCYSIAYNILSNCEDSEECVSDTYVGIWNAVPPTRPNNLMSFICKISRNLSLKRLEFNKRKKRSYEVQVSFEELEEVLPDRQNSSDISEEELGRLISKFLRTQNEEARNVFIRKYFFFDSVKEIAQHCHLTESKVKNMLFHTRKKLKDYLIKEGIEI